MNLPINIIHQIETFAKECFLDRVILFGSRARGTNRERSDIDLAVSGGNLASRKLKDNIQREGVLLYAKV